MAQPLNELEGIQQRWTMPWPLRMLLAGACLVVIIAGLKAVAPILSGFLAAMLLALVLTPVARKLVHWRVPKPLAILITMLGVFIGAALVIYLVVGGLIGVLAAVWPARRAARLDILGAITTE